MISFKEKGLLELVNGISSIVKVVNIFDKYRPVTDQLYIEKIIPLK